MRLRPALLEDWLRDYYFAAEIDISSSGPYPAGLRRRNGPLLLGLDRLSGAFAGSAAA
jgi:hypothetical protein